VDGASPWFAMRCCKRLKRTWSLFWTARLITTSGVSPACGVRGELCNRTINHSALEQRLYSTGREALISADPLQVIVDEHLGARDQARRHLLETGRGHLGDCWELRPRVSVGRQEGRRGATSKARGRYA
jgi:hypothetical protein